MLKYTKEQSSKGYGMEIVSNSRAWENSKDIYEMIYKVFPDKNQADGVASIFEKVIVQLDISAQKMVNEKVFFIIEKIREELDYRGFATKSDLEAGLTKLELKLMNKINELKLELKQDIAGVELRLSTEITKISTAIETNERNFGNKIKSLKFEMVGWIAGIMIVIPNIDKIWSFIKTLLQN